MNNKYEYGEGVIWNGMQQGWICSILIPYCNQIISPTYNQYVKSCVCVRKNSRVFWNILISNACIYLYVGCFVSNVIKYEYWQLYSVCVCVYIVLYHKPNIIDEIIHRNQVIIIENLLLVWITILISSNIVGVIYINIWHHNVSHMCIWYILYINQCIIGTYNVTI